MAFWGAFSPLEPEDYQKLCESALMQQESLKKLNQTWKSVFLSDLHVRI